MRAELDTMPKGKSAARARTPPDESGAVTGKKRRTLSAAGNSGDASKERTRAQKDQTATSHSVNGTRQRASNARTRSTEADENEGAHAAAAATASGAASLARFRYAGPSAGPHQCLDPTTLRDTMSSSDPVTGDNSPKRASRPPKRVHEDQDAAPRKARTPPSDKFARKRTLKREPEPVFVFPELDEDGNPIEDELSDNPRAAQLSSASSPVRLKVPDVPGAMRAAADEFSTTMRSPSKPSPARDAVAANLPPSSIELPNMLADRIYRASPARATRLPETARQTPVKDSPKHDEAFTPAPAKADRLAPALKSQGLAGGSIQEQEKAKRLAPTSSPIAKLVAAVPKQLSAADLRAVAEVLDDLDSQVFSDVDADVPAVSGRRAEHGSIAVEGSEPL